MPKIKLTILASDMKETDYLDNKDCPITRALYRAGYKGWRDTGTTIMNEKGERKIVDKSYHDMTNKIVRMMGYKEKKNSFIKQGGSATDFDWELEYVDEE